MSWGYMLRIRRMTHRRQIYECQRARMALILIWLLAIFAAIILYCLGGAFQSRARLAGLGSALGGATSNLLDILRRRAIVNFVDLGWWPAFNLADVGIAVGLTLAFFAGA